MRSTFVLVLSLACGPASEPPPSTSTEPTAPTTVTREGASPPPDAWVRDRVEASNARLQASEAGRLVAQSIEAHGGLATWLGAGTLGFEFDYRPLAQPERRMRTYQRVDLWSARAHHRELGALADTPVGGPVDDAVPEDGVPEDGVPEDGVPEDGVPEDGVPEDGVPEDGVPEDGVPEDVVNAPLATFGWDGSEAWITPDASAFPSTARFWSLTPYFFLGMPFVAADPGTRYERLADAELDGVAHQLVKLTYDDGTGDAPNDYYVLYLHPETHRLAALRYVVSYPGFFGPGEHSPEKLMRFTEPTTVAGLSLATRLDTYAWSDATGRGEKVTEIAVRQITLGESWPDAIFARPDGAEVSELARRE